MEYCSAIKNNEFMKFLGKWVEQENIVLSEIIQSQKGTHGMHSLISGYYPQSSQYPRYNSQTIWSSRRNTKLWMLQFFWEGEQNTHGRKYGDKVWSRDWTKGHPETAPTGDPSHTQSPYPDILVDDNRCLLDALSLPLNWAQGPQWRS